MLFAYDFPHKKTQDFILRLFSEGYKIEYIIAAPWEKLNFPESTVRIAPQYTGLIHPEKICRALKIFYLRMPHNGKRSVRFLQSHPVDLYIISGARILSREVIRAAKSKILNIHPGLLPEVRGLDTLLWSIYKDIPIGLSAHFVGEKIDSGLFIDREKLQLYHDDTLLDISLRLLESQTDFLIKVLDKLEKKSIKDLKNFDKLKATYHHKMPGDLEKKSVSLFNNWLKKYAI